MSQVIPILTVVDATGLATTGSVNGNAYIFDNIGSYAAGSYQYTFDIVINNTHYAFDPFLQIGG